MNHFMLPRMIEGMENPGYCGTESTERLIETILKVGVSIGNIRAKVFGGGRVTKLFQREDLGRENVAVAKEALARYHIPIVSELTEQDCSTKVVFYSATGRVFVKGIKNNQLDHPVRFYPGG